MALKNYYTAKRVDSGVLEDLNANNDGFLKGENLPKANDEFLSFRDNGGGNPGDYSRIEFDQSDYRFNSNEDFSLVLNFRSEKTDDNYHHIFSNGINAASRFFICITNTEAIIITLRNENLEYYSAFFPVNICDGKWHLIQLSYNSSESSLISSIDKNQLIGENIARGNYFSENSKVSMGAAYSEAYATFAWPFFGDIQEFRNYAHSLSIGEISDNYTYKKGMF